MWLYVLSGHFYIRIVLLQFLRSFFKYKFSGIIKELYLEYKLEFDSITN